MNVIDDLEKLRERLKAMPVPEPRPGFVDRALATASGARSTHMRGIRATLNACEGELVRTPRVTMPEGLVSPGTLAI